MTGTDSRILSATDLAGLEISLADVAVSIKDTYHTPHTGRSNNPRKTDRQAGRLRDRVLFETAYVCGARASEVCGLYVEDLDLRLDDEHVRIHGKGGSVRTVLLDDRGYVALLKPYLARASYTAGPLFRASINGRGPLSYDAAHHRWQTYCAQAGVEIDIHQLRHPTPPNSSTPAFPSRLCAAASATPPPKPASCTRCWTTRWPTPRSAPHADVGTGQRAEESSQPRAASARCNQDPSQRQRLSAGSSPPVLKTRRVSALSTNVTAAQITPTFGNCRGAQSARNAGTRGSSVEAYPAVRQTAISSGLGSITL
ncbi:tyrosine-type recombinase/integrase [Nonomuraea sp. 10N515B]|uniref:tyrosine-type recombinase/integrase n=1 Tax=Nonomuraea sp. 10N515B TaxID=3457422 RepID=UPI003FCCB9E5